MMVVLDADKLDSTARASFFKETIWNTRFDRTFLKHFNDRMTLQPRETQDKQTP